MSRVFCKFTHDTSLVFEGTRMTMAGSPLADWFDFLDYGGGSVSDAVNLAEGVVHVLFDSGAVFQINAAPETGFTIQKVRN